MEKTCKWCGHGNRLDRGEVKPLSYWAGLDEPIENERDYHGGCYTAMIDCENRIAAKEARFGTRRR